MNVSGKTQSKAARTARLSAALRENLKRRKAQARSRAQAGDSKEAPSAETASHGDAPDFRRNRGRE